MGLEGLVSSTATALIRLVGQSTRIKVKNLQQTAMSRVMDSI